MRAPHCQEWDSLKVDLWTEKSRAWELFTGKGCVRMKGTRMEAEEVVLTVTLDPEPTSFPEQCQEPLEAGLLPGPGEPTPRTVATACQQQESAVPPSHSREMGRCRGQMAPLHPKNTGQGEKSTTKWRQEPLGFLPAAWC